MKRFCVLTGLMLACSTVAIAQEDGAKPEDLFKQLDRNGDGKLVPDEIPEKQTRFFERLVRLGDADKDGELTQSEFKKATSETADTAPASGNGSQAGRRPGNSGQRQFDSEEFFKRLDRNGDGKIAKSELPDFFAQRLAPAFEKLGKDAMTLDEFREFRRQAERTGSGQTDGRSRQMRSLAEAFKRLDENGDGKLSIDEIPEQATRIIAYIRERSENGGERSLTLQEFQEAVAQFSRDRQTGRPGSDRPQQDGTMRRPDQGDRPAGGPAFLRILDANQDGKLSREELAKAVTLIDRLDRNGDGALDPRELFGSPESNQNSASRSHRPQNEQSDKDSSSQAERAGSDSPRREGRSRGGNAAEAFKRMDQDNDGSISRDEAPDRLKQNFDRIDVDKSGSVSLEELRRMFERSRRE